MNSISKYDPNIYWSKQEVEVTLMRWDYSAKIKVETGGNVKGWDIIKSAIEQIYDILSEKTGVGAVTLTNPGGATLLCEDDEEREDDWVREMIVSAVIISQEREVLSDEN